MRRSRASLLSKPLDTTIGWVVASIASIGHTHAVFHVFHHQIVEKGHKVKIWPQLTIEVWHIKLMGAINYTCCVCAGGTFWALPIFAEICDAPQTQTIPMFISMFTTPQMQRVPWQRQEFLMTHDLCRLSLFNKWLTESVGPVPFSTEYLICRHVQTDKRIDGQTDGQINPGWAG